MVDAPGLGRFVGMEELDVAVRAWAVPSRSRYRRPEGEYVDLGPSEWSLTFDTETLVDASQRLRLGTYQVRRGKRLVQAGILVDPDVLTLAELTTVRAHAKKRGWRVRTRAEFADGVFYPVALELGGIVVGFNLPFDISRLATDHGPAKSPGGAMRGGFAFRLSDKHPPVQVKRIGARAAFIRLAIGRGRNPEQRNREGGGSQHNLRGYFVDVATLADALLSTKGSLRDLADILQTEHRKLEATHGKEITPEYLDYAMRDVLVTWECFVELRAKYEAYGLRQTPLWRVYSGASIGKAHLREMGLKPWRKVQPRFPNRITATILETYYGGRTEARIRRQAIPGVYLDFQSQYPTSFVLQGLWGFCMGRGIRYRTEPPARVQALLDNVAVDDVLEPEFWSQLHALVLVQSDNDRLPTRARYGGNDAQWAVAVSRRSGGPPQWWTLADCVASKLHTGKAPAVMKVIRFFPGEPQEGLMPVDIAGEPRYRVDPYRHDPIKRLVELRASTRAESREAAGRGDEDRVRVLDAIQQGMKVAANAISYGIGIEVNVVRTRRPAGATVYRSDGSRFWDRFDATEDVGTYFNPLVASLAAAGGRLLLATAMAALSERGGTYAICDTDSLFVPARKQPAQDSDWMRMLTWEEVRSVVDRFSSLNPFDRDVLPGSALKIEADNFDQDGNQREIFLFSIASKRYALFTWSGDRLEIIGVGPNRRRSRHGLGHLLAPGTPKLGTPDPDYIDAWWGHLLRLELDLYTAPPEWFGEAAAGRLPVTSASEESAFGPYNNSRAYAERVRPFNFLMTFHTHQLVRSEHGIRSLVAPFDSDRRNWGALVAIDRKSGTEWKLQTKDPHVSVAGRMPVQTYGDYFEEYRVHPELKLAAADGRPCHPWSRGPLSPRQVVASGIVRIGKTSGRITEDQTSHSESDRAVDYPDPRLCGECLALLADRRARYCSNACKQRAYRKRQRHRRQPRLSGHEIVPP
jgi:hypothetical protein